MGVDVESMGRLAKAELHTLLPWKKVEKNPGEAARKRVILYYHSVPEFQLLTRICANCGDVYGNHRSRDNSCVLNLRNGWDDITEMRDSVFTLSMESPYFESSADLWE